MTKEYKVFIVLVTIISLANEIRGQQLKSLKVLSEWKEMEFEFPTPETRKEDIAKGLYIPGNAVPMDVDIYYKGKGISTVFVTFPRLTYGIPITLGILSEKYGPNGPYVKAYPNYDMQDAYYCNEKLTSVYRVAIDECQRLWVLDSGSINNNRVCPAKILAFDLRTDEIVIRFEIPENFYMSGLSLLANLVVDVRGPGPSGVCGNTMVYKADATGFGVIVYDHQNKRAWLAQNKYFHPNPENSAITIRGESMDLMYGVLGMALSPRKSVPLSTPSSSSRLLYFHSLASITENSVPLSVLDDALAWIKDPYFSPISFVKIGSRYTQSAAQAMDTNGNMFFGLMNSMAIGCWDSSRPYTIDNMRVVAQNNDTLQFASGIKVVRNAKGKEELLVLTNRYHRVINGSITSSDINFRILLLELDDLLSGTQCTRGGIAFPKY